MAPFVLVPSAAMQYCAPVHPVLTVTQGVAAGGLPPAELLAETSNRYFVPAFSPGTTIDVHPVADVAVPAKWPPLATAVTVKVVAVGPMPGFHERATAVLVEEGVAVKSSGRAGTLSVAVRPAVAVKRQAATVSATAPIPTAVRVALRR